MQSIVLLSSEAVGWVAGVRRAGGEIFWLRSTWSDCASPGDWAGRAWFSKREEAYARAAAMALLSTEALKPVVRRVTKRRVVRAMVQDIRVHAAGAGQRRRDASRVR